MKLPPHLAPDDSSSKPSTGPKHPLWETIVIALSFVGVWIYFFAWLLAGRAEEPLSAWWQLLLLPCLVALFIVFRQRFKRAQAIMRENKERQQPHF